MKKILSIDGGGIRGIIPAMVLAEIEERTERSTAENFDLIAGTSTGGILALGLSLPEENRTTAPRFSAQYLAELYQTRGREIFERSFWDSVSSVPGLGKLSEKVSVLDNLFEEEYANDGLRRVLQDNFGDNLLGNTVEKDSDEEDSEMKKVLTMVTCYDIQARNPLFLKSWRDTHAQVKMVDAALATSAAPTYFEPHQFSVNEEDRTLIDGGVFINTPVVSAYAEAVREFGADEELFVLSLGTGELTREIKYQEAKNWGKIGWALPLLYCIFDGVSKAAHYQMRRILTDTSYYHLTTRLNGANDDMDDASGRNINGLINLANQLIVDENDTIEEICKQLDA